MSIRSRWREFRLGIRPTIDELKFTMRRIRSSPLSILGICIVGFFAAIAILAPVLAPSTSRDPFTVFHDNWAQIPRPPGSNITDSYLNNLGWTVHYFGTEQTQVDIYYGCIWGTQTAFRIGVLVVAISLAIGLLTGSLAGYYGGVIDEVLMRFTDIMLAFPGLILAMALVIALPPSWPIDFGFIGLAIMIFLSLMLLGRSKKLSLTGIWPFMLGLLGLVVFVTVDSWILGMPPILVESLELGALDKVLIALALVGWPGYTRVIRGEILRVRQEDYVEASKAVGCSDFRIVVRHILPSAIYPVIIIASLDIGSMVLTAAALSFLGIGAPVGYADWGQMISMARNWIWAGTESPWMYWYTFIIPGLFIFTFVLGWNLLGDAFRDVLDPTLRRR
jgi:peptide/nickel transport system permease protein